MAQGFYEFKSKGIFVFLINEFLLNKKVDVIGVGPPKTATTWIADVLRDHPQVYVPKEKELHYFNPVQHYHRDVVNRNSTQPESWYHDFFENAPSEVIWAEFTVSYFEFPECAERIFKYNPKAKIIISLREPVARAFSHYLFLKNKGVIGPESFEDYVEQDSYVFDVSMYAENLKKYLEVFPKDQILVLLHEDLRLNAQNFYDRIIQFLGADATVDIDLNRVSNAATKVKSHKLNSMYMGLREWIHKKKLYRVLDVSQALGLTKFLEWIRDEVNMAPSDKAPKMSADLKRKYGQLFEEDRLELQRLLNRDLSEWD